MYYNDNLRLEWDVDQLDKERVRGNGMGAGAKLKTTSCINTCSAERPRSDNDHERRRALEWWETFSAGDRVGACLP